MRIVRCLCWRTVLSTAGAGAELDHTPQYTEEPEQRGNRWCGAGVVNSSMAVSDKSTSRSTISHTTCKVLLAAAAAAAAAATVGRQGYGAAGSWR